MLRVAKVVVVPGLGGLDLAVVPGWETVVPGLAGLDSAMVPGWDTPGWEMTG